MQKEVNAIILAAGSSKRLQPALKQLCKIENSGPTLLEYVVNETLKVPSISSVSVVLGYQQELIRKQVQFPNNVHVVVNEEYEKGLGRSIAVGVTHVESIALLSSSILLLLVDHYELDQTYLESIVRFHLQGYRRDKISISEYQGGGMGPPVIFGPDYTSDIKKLNSKQGAKRVIQHHLNKTEKFQSSGFYGKDLDTIEDLKASGLIPPDDAVLS